MTLEVGVREAGWARGPMSEATQEAIARMYAAGATLAMISEQTRRTQQSIKRAIEGPLAERVASIRGIEERDMRIHFMSLRELLPRLRAVIKDGLESRHEKTRIDTAKWLHEILMPKQSQRVDHDVTIFSSPEVIAAVHEISQSAKALGEARSMRPLRVRTGLEALPGFAADLASRESVPHTIEVINLDAQPA